MMEPGCTGPQIFDLLLKVEIILYLLLIILLILSFTGFMFAVFYLFINIFYV